MAGDDSERGDDTDPIRNALLASYSAVPELTPIPEFQYAEPKEYDASLSPKETLAQFPFSRDTAIIQLYRELAVARIVGIAEHVIWSQNGATSQVYYLIIPTWFWSIDTPLDHDFWMTGYRERFLPTKGYRVDEKSWIKLFGVRFWSANWATPTDQETQITPVDENRKPLPEAEAKRVSGAILQFWGKTVTEARAFELAKGMCPSYQVSRDPFLGIFRSIRGPKNPGKQPSNGK